jgi:hypothetical protein
VKFLGNVQGLFLVVLGPLAILHVVSWNLVFAPVLFLCVIGAFYWVFVIGIFRFLMGLMAR